MKGFGKLVLIAGVGVAIWLALPWLFFIGWFLSLLVRAPFVEKEPNLYYRIEASLQVDGQPVQMEAVVRCHPNVSSPLAGGGSLSYSTWPGVVGRKLEDGSGVFLATGNGGCSWLRHDHTAQPIEGLPIVLWLPDYVKRDRGELYFLQQHFDAAESHVRLERASVRPATEADYTAWLWRTKPEAPTPYEALGRAHDLGIETWKQAPQLVCPAAIAISQTEWETWPGFKEWADKQTGDLVFIPRANFGRHLVLRDERGAPRFASILHPGELIGSSTAVETAGMATIRPYSEEMEQIGSSVYPYMITETATRYDVVVSSPTNRPRPCAAVNTPDASKRLDLHMGDATYTFPPWQQGAVFGTLFDEGFFDRSRGVVYITVVSGVWFYAFY